jgi:GT2 family glycosyltransferase
VGSPVPRVAALVPMTAPLVDISIPVFGRSRYVGEAVESVLAQTYPHWRLTISEDRATTSAVARAVDPYLTDERIRYVTPGEHLGLARHKTWLVARGEGRYVALLDDDDRWLPDWLRRRVEFMAADPGCVLVWGGHVDIDSDGVTVGRSSPPLSAGLHSSRGFVEAMLVENVVSTPSVLFARDAYARAGGRFDDTFVHINDYELWIRLGLLGPVGVLDVQDSAYRVHPEQMSRCHDPRALDHLRLLGHVDRLLTPVHPDLRLAPAVLRRRQADRRLGVALDAAGEGRPRESARQLVAAASLAPRALASARGLAAVAATVGGRRVSRRLAAMRS